MRDLKRRFFKPPFFLEKISMDVDSFQRSHQIENHDINTILLISTYSLLPSTDIDTHGLLDFGVFTLLLFDCWPFRCLFMEQFH